MEFNRLIDFILINQIVNGCMYKGQKYCWKQNLKYPFP